MNMKDSFRSQNYIIWTQTSPPNVHKLCRKRRNKAKSRPYCFLRKGDNKNDVKKLGEFFWHTQCFNRNH